MKKFPGYLQNPFGMITVNPAGKKKRARARKGQRNPAKKKPGIVLLRKPSKNPAAASAGNGAAGSAKKRRNRRKKNPPISAGPIRRKVGEKEWHHKRGLYLYNPSQKKTRSRKVSSVDKNQPEPTMKKRRRSRSRSRNPVRRSSRRRSRNPSHRSSRRRRMRNPNQIFDSLLNANVMTLAAALLVGTSGTKIIINHAIATPQGGTGPRFRLPGYDFSVSGAAFWEKNKWVNTAYETAIPFAAGWFLRDQSPRFSQGLIASATFNLLSGFVNNSGVLANYGVGRYFPGNGMGSYTPGVPAIFTGPGSSFIGRGLPTPRGMSASVGPGFVSQAATAAPNPF